MSEEPIKLEGMVEIPPSSSLKESLERLRTEPPPDVKGPLHYKRGLTTHPDVEAMLDERWRRVLCGQPGCETLIARVRTRAENQTLFRQIPDHLKFITFLRGWAPTKDGVWALSAHSRKKIIQGYPPGLRRRPKTLKGVGENEVMNDFYELLPIVVVCPTCEALNLINPEKVHAREVLVVPLG